MEHGAVRKLTRAAVLSLLVLATTSGVAGLEVLAASPAMAEPDAQGQGQGQGQGGGSDPGQPGDPTTAVTKLAGGVIGGSGGGSGSAPGSGKAADPAAAVTTLAGGIVGGGALGH
jgi:hypothetical protein